MAAFGKASADRLASVAPALADVMREAIKTSPVDFSITCGYRDAVEQTRACMEGKSKVPYPKSKHNCLPSLAVDVCPYVEGRGLVWGDHDLWGALSEHIFDTAARMGVTLRWGGNWGHSFDATPPLSFIDKPHWELVV
jgi:peptidoglycan L-alanyl-D-glutamate endopeptidase CwlK